MPYPVAAGHWSLSPDGNFLYFPPDMHGRVVVFNLAAKREGKP